MTTHSDTAADRFVGDAIRIGPPLRSVATPDARPVSPEPPGARAVALALVRSGMVSGARGGWRIAGGDHRASQLCAALDTLAVEGAIDPMTVGPHRLTEHGEALYGPDLRQRHWLSVR